MMMEKGDKNLEKDGRKKDVRQQVENSNKNFEKNTVERRKATLGRQKGQKIQKR